MREILFRAKRHEDYGDPTEWQYGVPFEDYQGDWIMKTGTSERVIQKDTIGQFTGLCDKNDVKIFEGDIVRYSDGRKVRCGRVFFSDFRASFSVTADKDGSGRINNDLYRYIQNDNTVEVLGNIHDNPEILGGA